MLVKPMLVSPPAPRSPCWSSPCLCTCVTDSLPHAVAYTCVADLTEARRDLVKSGRPIQEGSWSSSSPAENDGDIYFSSVREAQQQLQEPSVAACPAPAGAAGCGGAGTVDSRKLSLPHGQGPDVDSDTTRVPDNGAPILEVVDDDDLCDLD